MTTTVLDSAASAAAVADSAAACIPATCRIGLLGLGNVGSAFARHAREAASHLAARGFAPIVATALVRSTSRPRAAADFVTTHHRRSRRLLRRAGRRHRRGARRRRAGVFAGAPRARSRHPGRDGEQVADRGARRGAGAARPPARARRCATRRAASPASRSSARSSAGRWPRAPPASRRSSTAPRTRSSRRWPPASASMPRWPTRSASASRNPIPRWTSAAPTPPRNSRSSSALFGRLLVDPSALPLEGIGGVEPDDIAAAVAFDGAIRPVAQAVVARPLDSRVRRPGVRRRHAPARARQRRHQRHRDHSPPAAQVAGAQCFIGPGAGPDVTAATLLDDVAELMTERRVRTPRRNRRSTRRVDHAPALGMVRRGSTGSAQRVRRRGSPRLLRHLDARGSRGAAIGPTS